MTEFHALLIGVPHYGASDFPDIPYIQNDLDGVRRALTATGYPEDRIRVVSGAEGANRPTTGEIRQAIEEQIVAAGEGILLIYFSGHGVSLRGSDYVVPAGIPSRSSARANPDLLVSTDLSRFLTNCKARAVILAVDACREILDEDKGLSLRAGSTSGRGALNPAHKTRVATIFGCDAGQTCLYSDDLKMSLFAKALATVLAPQHPARTLTEVSVAVRDELAELVRRFKPNRVQNAVLAREYGSGDLADQQICASEAAEWQTAIDGSPLWNRVRPGTDVSAERKVAEQLAGMVWRTWHAARAELPDDPWRDADLYRRCLEAMDQLIPEDAELFPAEALTLIAAPLIAEATHVAGIRALVPYEPRNLRRDLGAAPVRRELEAMHSAHSRVWQKAVSLDQRPGDQHALADWLAHRCVFRQVGLWRSEPTISLSRLLAETIEDRPGFRGELTGAVLGLASMLGASEEDLTVLLNGTAQGDRLRAAAVRTFRGERGVLRGRTLAVVLSVAGVLALDVRRLGEVVVDHIGIHQPLEPAALHRAVQDAEWEVDHEKRTLALTARCSHQAIHLALREAAEEAQQQLRAMRQWLDEAPGRSDGVIGRLPLTVSTAGLKPEEDFATGRKPYETPLLQFRLDHREIRDLLMGVQLYGDPALAIRELYQNALDACRYRDVRTQFKGQDYRGKISFTQSFDEDGREYIECVDNGVGMGRSELKNTFSKAGRRFVNSTDFLWEQAEWQKTTDLRFWPNSRFGIGVFSYFMLADEILIETARVDRETNAPRETLEVRIASSGSLFRINTVPSRPGVGAGGGTRVRLYLRPNPESPVSCVDTVRQLLWYSEFEVEARDAGRRLAWPPGELRPPQGYKWVEPANGIWWVEGSGMVLSDGIATDRRVFGYVANLSGEHSATLSVDRKSVEAWDRKWVRAQLTEAIDRLVTTTNVTFTWLRAFAVEEPGVAQSLVEAIGERGRPLPNSRDDNRSARIADVGLWPVKVDGDPEPGAMPGAEYDGRRLWQMSVPMIGGSAVARWRAGGVPVALDGADIDDSFPFSAEDASRLPAAPHGHPLFEPMDIPAVLRPPLVTSSDDLTVLLENSQVQGRPVADLLSRTRRFVVHGAVPPPSTGDDWNRVADVKDIQVCEAFNQPRSEIVVLAEFSYRTQTPLASWVERAEAILRLKGRRPLGITLDPEYKCRAQDVAALEAATASEAAIFAGGALKPHSWVHALLARGCDRPGAMQLLTAFGQPVGQLVRLAEAVWDDRLLAVLSENALPGSGPSGWLHGEVTTLDLLVAVTARLGTAAEIVAELALFAEVLDIRLPADAARLPTAAAPAEALPVLRAVNRHRRLLTRLSERDRDESSGERPALLAWLCAQCLLSPDTILATLRPFGPILGVSLPDNRGLLPERPPTDVEATLLTELIDSGRRGTTWERVKEVARKLGRTPDDVLQVAQVWGVPVNDEQSAAIGGVFVLPAGGEGLPKHDLVVLSHHSTGSEPFRAGCLSPASVLMSAVINGESIARTLERVTELGGRFPISAREFDWGDMLGEVPPNDLRWMDRDNIDLTGSFLIFCAGRYRNPISDVVNRYQALLRLHQWPEISDGQLRDLSFCPDDIDMLSALPYLNTQAAGDVTYSWNGHHVIRVAARLGMRVGEIGRRVARLRPLLGTLDGDGEHVVVAPALMEVPAGLADRVPDWRDVVILTPGLDGRRLVTDVDLTDEWITRAAREVEASEDEVRRRLALFAEYCGFTAPAVD
ncbi:caspase family protein [Actinoplanes sp. NPDC020271]|uniref:HD domain-containing protein n=1 Tax=Actinoplanes sp. NPDC020271 TaxID=3363896 RepID=UPI00379DFADF